jgi:CRP/FNR family transcriptional regulator
MAFSLKDIPFFSALSEESLKKLERISYFKSYNAGELVFYEGDPPSKLYIIVDGVLRLYKTDNKGHEIYIHQFTPTAMVGELANFENIPYPASARFITKGTVLKIEFKDIEEDFFKNPDISMEIIKSLTRKLKILSNVIHHEMVLTSEAKVAKLIYEHKELFEKIKNNQIAAIINVSPETLSRTLTKLKKSKIISVDSNHVINILDSKTLRELYLSN